MEQPIPEPKDLKRYATDAVKVLAMSAQSDNANLETLLAYYVEEPRRHEWLTRSLISIALKFGDDAAAVRGVDKLEMLDAYAQAFDEGPGWPLSEYL